MEKPQRHVPTTTGCLLFFLFFQVVFEFVFPRNVGSLQRDSKCSSSDFLFCLSNFDSILSVMSCRLVHGLTPSSREYIEQFVWLKQIHELRCTL